MLLRPEVITGEGGNQEVGDRRAQPGGQVVAGLGGVAVVAVDDVVEVGRREASRGRAGSGCSRSGACRRPSARPWSAMAIRPAQMGEAALVPASPSQPTADAETRFEPAQGARENVVFLGSPGVHRNVGKRAGAVGSMLEGTTPVCQDGSVSTSLRPPPRRRCRAVVESLAPADFAGGTGSRVVAGRVDHDRRPPDGDDVGRRGRIVRRRPGHRRRR